MRAQDIPAAGIAHTIVVFTSHRQLALRLADYAQRLKSLAETVHRWLGVLSELDHARRLRVAGYAEAIADTLARTVDALEALNADAPNKRAYRQAIRELGRICGYIETMVAALEHQLDAFATTEPANWSLVFRHTRHTRRRFAGRHPLCGSGVTSSILRIFSPADCRAVMADSRPEPGPFTRTSNSRTPIRFASLATNSAARWAANGVLLRVPENFRSPPPT